MKRTALIRSASVAVLLASAALLLAGPLDPPSGPVGSTYKTLDEIEPRIAINATNTPGDGISLFRITQPGSYYLTGNVTGVSGLYSIYIDADNVTIDLNGFTLAGVAGSKDGIQGYEGISNTTIRNGVVTGWGRSGIYIGGGSYGTANGFLIEDVTASNNTHSGINAGYLGSQGVIARCVAHDNGIGGISAYGSVTIEACTATSNGSDGIFAQYDCVVRGCVASSNGASGIAAGWAVVTGCSVDGNDQDGIRVTYRCIVRENTCTQNGTDTTGAGIHATSSDNRIEENNCAANSRGFDIDSAGNFIARNICSGNTTVNWDVAAGNTILIVNAATNQFAIFGNSGGAAPGSTDPNANFTY